MSDTFFTIKEVKLNNNCPECYSQEDLQLTFKQKITENSFYKAVTNETVHSLHCNKCNTEIFPARWTDEIDQVVDYHIRATNPKPKAVKLKKTTWIIILAVIVILLGIVLFKAGVFG